MNFCYCLVGPYTNKTHNRHSRSFLNIREKKILKVHNFSYINHFMNENQDSGLLSISPDTINFIQKDDFDLITYVADQILKFNNGFQNQILDDVFVLLSNIEKIKNKSLCDIWNSTSVENQRICFETIIQITFQLQKNDQITPDQLIILNEKLTNIILLIFFLNIPSLSMNKFMSHFLRQNLLLRRKRDIFTKVQPDFISPILAIRIISRSNELQITLPQICFLYQYLIPQLHYIFQENGINPLLGNLTHSLLQIIDSIKSKLNEKESNIFVADIFKLISISEQSTSIDDDILVSLHHDFIQLLFPFLPLIIEKDLSTFNNESKATFSIFKWLIDISSSFNNYSTNHTEKEFSFTDDYINFWLQYIKKFPILSSDEIRNSMAMYFKNLISPLLTLGTFINPEITEFPLKNKEYFMREKSFECLKAISIICTKESYENLINIFLKPSSPKLQKYTAISLIFDISKETHYFHGDIKIIQEFFDKCQKFLKELPNFEDIKFIEAAEILTVILKIVQNFNIYQISSQQLDIIISYCQNCLEHNPPIIVVSTIFQIFSSFIEQKLWDFSDNQPNASYISLIISKYIQEQDPKFKNSLYNLAIFFSCNTPNLNILGPFLLNLSSRLNSLSDYNEICNIFKVFHTIFSRPDIVSFIKSKIISVSNSLQNACKNCDQISYEVFPVYSIIFKFLQDDEMLQTSYGEKKLNQDFQFISEKIIHCLSKDNLNLNSIMSMHYLFDILLSFNLFSNFSIKILYEIIKCCSLMMNEENSRIMIHFLNMISKVFITKYSIIKIDDLSCVFETISKTFDSNPKLSDEERQEYDESLIRLLASYLLCFKEKEIASEKAIKIRDTVIDFFFNLLRQLKKHKERVIFLRLFIWIIDEIFKIKGNILEFQRSEVLLFCRLSQKHTDYQLASQANIVIQAIYHKSCI